MLPYSRIGLPSFLQHSAFFCCTGELLDLYFVCQQQPTSTTETMTTTTLQAMNAARDAE